MAIASATSEIDDVDLSCGAVRGGVRVEVDGTDEGLSTRRHCDEEAHCQGEAAYGVSPSVLVYRQDLGRNVQVQWLNRAGQVISSPVPEGVYRTAEPSPEGDRIALRRYDQATGGTLTVVDRRGGDRILSSSPSNDLSPRWSPDGQSVAFSKSDGIYMSQLGSVREDQQLLASESMYSQIHRPGRSGKCRPAEAASHDGAVMGSNCSSSTQAPL